MSIRCGYSVFDAAGSQVSFDRILLVDIASPCCCILQLWTAEVVKPYLGQLAGQDVPGEKCVAVAPDED